MFLKEPRASRKGLFSPVASKCGLATAQTLMMILLAVPAMGKIIHVDASAAGGNDGTSWADAYTFLKDALADAQDGEKPVEIRVAQGIYTPYRGEGSQRTAFLLMSNVAIRGGYAGSASPHPDEREFRLYRTVLSGDVLKNDTETTEALTYRESSREDNTSTIVKCDAVDGSAILEGCIVQGGQYNSPRFRGGGDITVVSAGGIRISGGSPTIINCTFAENLGHWGGGGIFVTKAGKPTLINCLIKLNGSTTHGGGLTVEDGHAEVINCRFEKNRCDQNGGAVYLGPAGTATLAGCYFVANNARSFGGAVADELGV